MPSDPFGSPESVDFIRLSSFTFVLGVAVEQIIGASHLAHVVETAIAHAVDPIVTHEKGNSKRRLGHVSSVAAGVRGLALVQSFLYP
jgi:hypothetical protein